MTAHPTPQPSGRTAEEILTILCSQARLAYKSDRPFKMQAQAKDDAQRQLFNAIQDMLGDYEAYGSNIDLNISKTQKYIKEKTGEITGRNSLRYEMEKQLRIFFDQPEASGMRKPVKLTLFDNGNVAVWDENGQQVPGLQGAFFDYKYLNKLAKAIADNNLEIEDLGSPACDFYERVKHFKRLAAPPRPEKETK